MLSAFDPTTIAVFSVAVLFFLWLDLHMHRGDQPVGLGRAALWSALWVVVSLLFAGYVGYKFSAEQASRFLAGYLLEKSLAADNLFVFMAIFASFAIRDSLQHRVLYYGIIGALLLRLLFISLGTGFLLAGQANQVLHMIVFSIFGAIVLWSAWQMYRSLREDDGPERHDYTDHWAVRMTRRVLPVHPALEGHRFLTRAEGRWKVTPLFLCLVAVEVSDIAFAFDSVPAVIAVTREPFLVYTSNIFAILGLRSMYFLLTAARRYLCHLDKAVIGILVYIGFKMLLDAFHAPLSALFGRPIDISANVSLGIVLSGLAIGVVCSWLFPTRKVDTERASNV